MAVTFVIPDSEKVTVGKFGTPAATMTAAVGRRIEPKEIRSIRPAPAIVGWRFYPAVRDAKFFWPQPGTIKARRKRTRINAEFA